MGDELQSQITRNSKNFHRRLVGSEFVPLDAAFLLNCSSSYQVILDVQDLLWRKVKSGFRKVESCSAGVTWAMDMNGSPIIMDPNNDSPIGME